VHDDDDSETAETIARHRIVPLLEHLGARLLDHESSEELAEEMLNALVEAYRAGHVDGQRLAVAGITTEAERHGLRLRLSPDLVAPEDGL
jgi:imidazolonepropionase-like amidohydrolase